MSLSPASFRRRIAYDVINDYVLPSLQKDSSIYERYARATLLPAFVISILERLKAREHRLKEAIVNCISAYKEKLHYDLPVIDEKQSVVDWYLMCVEKREGETLDDWINRVAICSHCILSFACLEEAVAPPATEIPY